MYYSTHRCKLHTYFHNATCGSIQLKQDQVTNAQYCILKVKKRKFTNAHTDSHNNKFYF